MTGMPRPNALDRLRDVNARLRDLPPADDRAAEAARAHQARLTKPQGALGRLEEMVVWLAAWQGREPPQLTNAKVLIFAGNHGITQANISAYPMSVTGQMLGNFAAGGAAINQLAAWAGATLRVVPLELHHPTKNFLKRPAMTEEECAQAINLGMAAVAGDEDVLVLGEMGIGNTTAAAALCAALYREPAVHWVGPGTGLDATGVAHKRAVIDQALATHQALLTEPLAILACLGGREIAALFGALVAARRLRVPVLLDGYVVTAAAAVLHALAPEALAHCLAAHRSAEPAHARLLERLGLAPLLDLGMRLGEASGAALALGVLRGALSVHTGMATFEQAGVSHKA